MQDAVPNVWSNLTIVYMSHPTLVRKGCYEQLHHDFGGCSAIVLVLDFEMKHILGWGWSGTVICSSSNLYTGKYFLYNSLISLRQLLLTIMGSESNAVKYSPESVIWPWRVLHRPLCHYKYLVRKVYTIAQSNEKHCHLWIVSALYMPEWPLHLQPSNSAIQLQSLFYSSNCSAVFLVHFCVYLQFWPMHQCTLIHVPKPGPKIGR